MKQHTPWLKKIPKTYLAVLIASSLSPAQAAQEKAGTLGKVVVEADVIEENSYIGKQASTSTKLDLSVKETPQSVSVITRKQINDMGATNLGQLLLQTTGIILTGDNSERTNFSIRGFNMGDGWNSNLMQYDGVPINASNVAASKPDMALVESIEILRGAAGLMQGSGEPSGTVNIIRKKPTAEFQANGALSYGSWDMYRGEADISNALNESGSVRGRAVVSYQDANSYMDAVTRDTNLVYGTISADLTSNTLMNIGYQRQGEHAVGAHNLPRNPLTGADLKLSRDNCSCNFSDYWDKANAQGFIDVEHFFENGWSVKGSYVRAKIEMDMVFTSLANSVQTPFNAENPKGNLNKYAYKYVQTLDVYDVFAKGNFDLLGRKHEFLFGANSQQSDIPGRWTSFDTVLNDYTLWDRSTPTPPKPRLEVDLNSYSPYDLPYLAPSYHKDGGRSYEDRIQTGVYATARFSLADPLNLIVGARHSKFDFDYKYKTNSTNQYVDSRRIRYEKDDVLTPYVGLTFDINETYTLYTSFADTFVVQNVKGTGDQLLDPIQGNVYEVGIKGSFNDDKLIASLATFRTNQINRPMRDESSQGKCLQNSDGYCNAASGEVISEGVEAEFRGEVSPGLNLTFGYTYNTTEYKKDVKNQGLVFNETTPEHIARLFSTYEFANKLTLGGGIGYQSEWWVGRYTAISAKQDDYILLNLMASYPINDTLTLTANADNALDEKYYSYLSVPSNRYGEPRNMKVTLRAKF